MSIGTALFTIGHSNRSIDEFLSLLLANSITAIADVRSSPHSRRNPHFNMHELTRSLQRSGIQYVYLGEELGARRVEPECYDDGQAKYELIPSLPSFQSGLIRLRAGLKTHRIAMLCAEKDPLICHRMILVCRHLRGEIDIFHIIDDAPAETQSVAETRLLAAVGLEHRDLFGTADDLLAEAYQIQGNRIAYRKGRQPESAASVQDE